MAPDVMAETDEATRGRRRYRRTAGEQRRVTARIRAELDDQLDAEADATGRPKAAIVEDALERHFRTRTFLAQSRGHA